MDAYDIREWLRTMRSYFTHEIPHFQLEPYLQHFYAKEVTGKQLTKTQQQGGTGKVIPKTALELLNTIFGDQGANTLQFCTILRQLIMTRVNT